MPYPRIHITNVRGHGIPPCPLCVFPPGGACSPHGMHGTHRSLGCVFSPRTHLGGYGILPYPRHPLNNSPTDGTDQHRWLGCVGFSHGIHGIHRSFWQRRASHRFHRWFGCVGFCGKIVWCLRGYGRDAMPSYNCTDWGLKFCVFCAICGRISQQKVSVSSANSVGGCSIAWLVQWRPLHPLGGCVGMAGMPYPPIIAQTGWTKILRVLCNPWENISVRNICAHLCHLWEDISARGFCGFCEFCGRVQWLLGWCCWDSCTPWEGRCKKSIDFFVVTKFHCIFAM